MIKAVWQLARKLEDDSLERQASLRDVLFAKGPRYVHSQDKSSEELGRACCRGQKNMIFMSMD